MAQEKTPLDLVGIFLQGLFDIIRASWQKAVVEPRKKRKAAEAELKAQLKADSLNAAEEAKKENAAERTQSFSASREKTLGTGVEQVRSQGVPQSKKTDPALDADALRGFKGAGSSPSSVKQTESKGTVSKQETVKQDGVADLREAREKDMAERTAGQTSKETAKPTVSKEAREAGAAARKTRKKEELAAAKKQQKSLEAQGKGMAPTPK